MKKALAYLLMFLIPFCGISMPIYGATKNDDTMVILGLVCLLLSTTLCFYIFYSLFVDNSSNDSTYKPEKNNRIFTSIISTVYFVICVAFAIFLLINIVFLFIYLSKDFSFAFAIALDVCNVFFIVFLYLYLRQRYDYDNKKTTAPSDKPKKRTAKSKAKKRKSSNRGEELTVIAKTEELTAIPREEDLVAMLQGGNEDNPSKSLTD